MLLDPDKSVNCVRQSLAEGTGWGGWQPCRRLPVMKKASHEKMEVKKKLFFEVILGLKGW